MTKEGRDPGEAAAPGAGAAEVLLSGGPTQGTRVLQTRLFVNVVGDVVPTNEGFGRSDCATPNLR